MRRRTGRQLNTEWNVGAQHALYREDGKWYHRLERLPAALSDAQGYVPFDSEYEYSHCAGLLIRTARAGGYFQPAQLRSRAH
jgi:hypothetical protein